MRVVVAFAAISVALPNVAAAYDCPADSNVCSRLVKSPTVTASSTGGGKTSHKAEWIKAPPGKYLTGRKVSPQGYTGRAVRCEIIGSGGVQQKNLTVGNSEFTVIFARRYRVLARAETGSGLGNAGNTAFMHCSFTARVTELPQ
jgi:hypothetical protein